MIKKRIYYFKLTKGDKESFHDARHRHLRLIIVRALRPAKANFFGGLDPKCSKTLWKYTWAIWGKICSVLVFTVNGVQVASNSGKANLLNNHFAHCFNTSVLPLTHGALTVDSSTPFLDKLLSLEDNLIFLLNNIIISNFSGPEEISGHMLKLTAYSPIWRGRDGVYVPKYIKQHFDLV